MADQEHSEQTENTKDHAESDDAPRDDTEEDAENDEPGDESPSDDTENIDDDHDGSFWDDTNVQTGGSVQAGDSAINTSWQPDAPGTGNPDPPGPRREEDDEEDP